MVFSFWVFPLLFISPLLLYCDVPLKRRFEQEEGRQWDHSFAGWVACAGLCW